MQRSAVLLVLTLVLGLSGCATVDRVLSRPAPSRHGTATRSPDVTPGRQYAPKTKPYTVMGKRYYPLRTAAGYDEVGIASWYGRDFHGKPTASGDIYDMHKMTAAHKTLPLGTVVRVTNLENGQRVNLLVNDRGPFVGTRIIDLSYAAAQALGSDRKGLARVRVQAVGTATARGTIPTATVPQRGNPAPPPQPTAQVRETQYAIQVGAFRDRSNADKVLRHLRSKGFSQAHVAARRTSRGTLHLVRVRAGSKTQARHALERVRIYYPSSFVTS
ncbi:rare lipoprotein A [Paucidesulfovibrio gracilis DSM 16080]|uniref:Probable endolytic peptidoglycan transglycosylase RlpA n=1 Tax=Paucidesulfovibrio gracilis DSM 16080 TaxID=1121449 RepID=A0A1T4WB89_9BACT|nr:septal ring lytic transglycosylase RlpA family protein [Paucidesulfovibrio gracilis]SKA73971.1 rare lipoprotein A [Paucidesulfovibrio gracilis DSM 16080]